MNNMHTARIQAWLNEVIVRQGDMQHKLNIANHIYQTNENELIAENRGVSIYSRLHVYTSGYVMRLLECLSADYQVLEKFLGKEVFDRFAKAALLWSPSTSYSLYDLGEVFIRFLEATRPQNVNGSDTSSIMLELPIEIARLERARQIVLRASGLEHRSVHEDVSFESFLFNPHAIRVKTPDTLKVLQLKFGLKAVFDAYYQQKDLPMPEARNTYMAVARMNFRVHTEEINKWQYCFLNAANKETSIMSAVQETASSTGIAASTLLADLFVWLPVFTSKGFIEIV